MAHCEQVQERLKSSNLPPNPKRGLMTILHHFRDKPARALRSFYLMHQSFYDREIFCQTKAEYQCADFWINSINRSNPTSVFSHYRVEQYLVARSFSDIVRFEADASQGKLPENMTDYNYVIYTTGLAKSFLAAHCSVEESLRDSEVNHFNLIYNSGNLSCIFSK